MTRADGRPRWAQPPERDESGRLAPEVLAAARRRVRRALLALIVVAIAAGLLAYGCSRSTKRGSQASHYAAIRAEASAAAAVGEPASLVRAPGRPMS